MKRYYYGDELSIFLEKNHDTILGSLLVSNEFPLEMAQRDAWLAQIEILKSVLRTY